MLSFDDDVIVPCIQKVKVVTRIRPDLSGAPSCIEHDDFSVTLTAPNANDVEEQSAATASTTATAATNDAATTTSSKKPSHASTKTPATQRSRSFTATQTPSTQTAKSAYSFTPLKTPAAAASGGGGNAKNFRFDRVFGPDATQSDVFEDIEPFVSAVFGGYNATVFVYGQTGSGKTHTMLGTKADPGVAPRVVAQLFAEMEARSSTLFAVQMTYIELYNDEFIDLLDPDNQPDKLAQLHVQARTATPHRRPKIELHARQGGGIDLVGSTTLRTSVCSAAEALKLLYAGRRARHTAQTQLNVESSRAHALLSFVVESRSAPNGPITQGKINLVDLAGSERLKKSQAEGDLLKETVRINSSLSALGDVLAALSSDNYSGPIPYRNNKLTRLLTDSLGGNSRTLFIVNLHPAAVHYHESVMSCLYGQRAKRIKNLVGKNDDASAANARFGTLQAQNDAMRAAVLIAQRDLKLSNSTVESMRQQQSELIRKLELAQASTAAAERALRAQCDEARDCAEQQGSAARSAQRAADDAVRELASINERYERVVSERDALQLRVAQLEQTQAELNNELASIKSSVDDVAKLKRQLTKRDAAIAELETALRESEARATSAEAALQHAAQVESTASAAAAAAAQKKKDKKRKAAAATTTTTTVVDDDGDNVEAPSDVVAVATASATVDESTSVASAAADATTQPINNESIVVELSEPQAPDASPIAARTAVATSESAPAIAAAAVGVVDDAAPAVVAKVKGGAAKLGATRLKRAAPSAVSESVESEQTEANDDADDALDSIEKEERAYKRARKLKQQQQQQQLRAVAEDEDGEYTVEAAAKLKKQKKQRALADKMNTQSPAPKKQAKAKAAAVVVDDQDDVDVNDKRASKATTKATRDAENAPSGGAAFVTAPAAAAAAAATDGDGKRKLFNGQSSYLLSPATPALKKKPVTAAAAGVTSLRDLLNLKKAAPSNAN